MIYRLVFVLATTALIAYAWLVFHANPTGNFVPRNLLPALLGWLLLLWVLRRHPRDPRWWLGWSGFCLPSLGLSGYLHMAFLLDWQGLASRAVTPDLLFRFLPWYVLFAGGIGFAIGWIIGRSLRQAPS